MDKIWDAIKRLGEIRRKKEQIKKKQRLLRERATRIDDLLKVMHQVGEVKLPIPNLFSYTQLEKYFDGIENIDLNQSRHVAAVAWFLEHQDDIRIASLPRHEIEKYIDLKMSHIPVSQLSEYVICIEEIFLAIKKKSISHERKILEDVLRMLEADGEKSSST